MDTQILRSTYFHPELVAFPMPLSQWLRNLARRPRAGAEAEAMH